MPSVLDAGPVMPPLGASTSSFAAPASQGLDPTTMRLATEFGQLLNQFAHLAMQFDHAAANSGGMAAPHPSSSATPPASSQAGGTTAAAPTASSSPSQPSPSQPGDPQTGATPVPASGPAASGVSAGTGPNDMKVTNNQDHAITVGEFKNGASTTDPSAKITLQPHQTGDLKYQNGDAGFAAQADASGKFQPNASRLEYEADQDGKKKFPDVSYITGRNAAIALTDGAGLNKGDSKSIAGSAPADIVTTDSGGNKTIAGSYDNSTAQMQAGGAFMQQQLGTAGAYLHPNDDTLPEGQNPMSETDKSTIYAVFSAA